MPLKSWNYYRQFNTAGMFPERPALTKCGLERAMGFEPTTTCLGSKDSTTELRPLAASNPTLAL